MKCGTYKHVEDGEVLRISAAKPMRAELELILTK